MTMRVSFAFAFATWSIATGVRFEVGDEEDTMELDDSFKVMQFNILADGLSGDGFVGPLKGRGRVAPKRVDNDWDKIVKKMETNSVKYGKLTDTLTSGTVGATENGTMAEYINDIKTLKKVVVDNLMKDLKVKFRSCYDKKKHTKGVGTCASEVMETFPIYEGHPVGSKPKSSTYEVPSAKLSVLSRGSGICGTFFKKNKLLTLCPEVNETETEKALSDVFDKYLNAAERLNRKYGLPMHMENLESMVEWGSTAEDEEMASFDASTATGRGQKLVQIIKNNDPAILGMEELDHYTFMHKALSDYTSTLPAGTVTKYTFNMDCKVKCTDTTFAFHPKCGSTAKKIHPSKNSADDDGTGIFWKKDRFEAVQIKKKTYDAGKFGKDGGLVMVLLKDKTLAASSGERYVWAIATHLDSGDKAGDELKRIAKMTVIAAEMRELDGASLNPCLKSTANSNCKVAKVVMMDGNSYQGFKANDTESGINITSKNNMYSKWTDMGFKNYEVSVADQGTFKQTAQVITASVNKIRGAFTQQWYKMGEYQMDRIDYVLSKQLTQVDKPGLSRYARYGGTTTQAKSPDDAFNEILPSEVNPSDHMPVTVTFKWK